MRSQGTDPIGMGNAAGIPGLPPSPIGGSETPAASPIAGVVRFAIVGTFVILAVGAMYYARSFFLPVILGGLITLTFSPLVRALGHRGIPAPLVAVILSVVLGAVLVTAAVLLSDPIAKMAAETPDVLASVRERFSFLRGPFEKIGAIGGDIDALLRGPQDGTQSVVVLQPGLLARIVDTLADTGTTIGAALLLAGFLLASGNVLRQKLVRVLPALRDKKRSLRVLSNIENEVSRYLLTMVVINVGLGTCVGGAMAILGMSNPILWGVAAGLLNFVPYLGPLIGISAAGAVAIAVNPTLAEAAMVPAAYAFLQFLESSFITPMILGRRLELNPVAILIMLSLTTWMWGIIGTVIGVPMLVVVKVVADSFPVLSPLSEFLSAETRLADDERAEPPAPEARP